MKSEIGGILLVQTPPWGLTTFPLGISYLAAYLRAQMVPVRVFDMNIELYNSVPQELQERWSNNEFEYWARGTVLEEGAIDVTALVKKIMSFKAEIIGFSTTFASIPFFNAVAEKVRTISKEVTIVVGGAGPAYKIHRNFFRRDLIDYFIIGEGEVLFGELIKKIKKGNVSFNNVECAQWKDNPQDKALCLQSKTPVDINTLPVPYFGGFNIDLYTEKDLLPIIASRGCVNACNFCCDWLLKRPFRSRRPELILEEIQLLISRYGRRRFEFSDLLINGHLEHLNTLCDLLIQAGSPIVWGGQAAVRSDMQPDLFVKMKKAGCGSLTFGFESFSNPLLQKMNKRFTAEAAAQAVRWAKEAGMLVEANLIVGFPGEEEDDVDATIDFLKNNRPFIDRVNSLNICSVGPGMTVWESALDFGIDKNIVEDWYGWHTADCSNTLQVRLERHKKIKEYIDGEQFGLAWENIRKNEEVVKDTL